MINREDLKYHNYKIQDFQKSEIFIDIAVEGDFQTEIIATKQNGVFLILKAETKRI